MAQRTAIKHRNSTPIISAAPMRRGPAFRGPFIQPQLQVGAAGDRYEQEAETVADHVMSMKSPAVSHGGADAGAGPNRNAMGFRGLTVPIQRIGGLAVTSRTQRDVIQRFAAPPDWADYVGLLIDAVELAWIELALPEGDEKNFRRLLNALFFAIDGILALTPGAGGGGIALRLAGQGGGALVWRLVPAGVQAKAIRMAAEQVGMPVARATQMINGYFAVAQKIEKPSKQVVQAASGAIKLDIWIAEIDRQAGDAPGVWGPSERPSRLYPDLTRDLADLRNRIELLRAAGRGPDGDPDITALIGRIRTALRALQTRANSGPLNSTIKNHAAWLEKFLNRILRPKGGKRMSP